MLWSAAALMLLSFGACAEGEGRQGRQPPLQPLIYTEYPGLTPEGAAVRERRLTRQFLEGRADPARGGQDDAEGQRLPSLSSPDALGQALTEALLTGDERLWEHTFISDTAYRRLVNVALEEAREFVDNQMGSSLPVWEIFAHVLSAELPDQGLQGLLQFERLELGRPRDIHGAPTVHDEEIVQFWGNRLIISHRHHDLSFSLPIARIFRLTSPGEPTSPADDSIGPRGQGGPSRAGHDDYHLASAIELSRRLRTFLGVGLHLRPQLLRPEEYPFPLGVGTFWRYHRYDAARGYDEDADPLARRFDERPQGLHAEQVIVEVRDLSNYGPLRLVELLRSYDDRNRTRLREWWVLTPRQIYLCDASCRANIGDVGALLDYFSAQAPLFRFPLRLGTSWGAAGHLTDQGGQFSVAPQWHQVSTPAGAFAATFQIAGTGALAHGNPYWRQAQLLRDFAPGRGVVRRQVFAGPGSLEGIDVVEELVEYRLIH